MDSFWFGIFSSLNFSEIMDNAFWNSFHGPSFLLGNLIRSVLWSGIGYIVLSEKILRHGMQHWIG